MKVIGFPKTEASVIQDGATRWTLFMDRIKGIMVCTANRLGLPGSVQSTCINDAVTGRRIEIQVGAATRISIDGRDYYFDRLSGKFTGTGSTCV